MQSFEIIIASPSDRERLVAEVWSSDEMIAELNQEGKNLELEIYTAASSLRLNYKEFLKALKTAERMLIGDTS